MNNPKYCKICGYVDEYGFDEKCIYCESELLSTSETYEDLADETENQFGISEYIRQLYVYCEEDFDENKSIYRELNSTLPKIKCPKCSSDQIQVVKRGWSIVSGFVGSGKNERICINCLHKF